MVAPDEAAAVVVSLKVVASVVVAVVVPLVVEHIAAAVAEDNSVAGIVAANIAAIVVAEVEPVGRLPVDRQVVWPCRPLLAYCLVEEGTDSLAVVLAGNALDYCLVVVVAVVVSDSFVVAG